MGKSIKIITILTMVLLINSCSINTKTVDDKNTDVVSNFIEPVNDTSNNYYENVKYYGAITKSISNEIIPIEMTITMIFMAYGVIVMNGAIMMSLELLKS